MVGLASGLGAALAAAFGLWPVALIGWLANRFLDGLDGAVARSNDRDSDAGGYLDVGFDVLVYAAIPIGVAIGIGSESVWIVTALLLGAFYLNVTSWLYLSALLEKRGRGAQSRGENTSVTMPVGLVEGTETVVWFAVMLAVPSLVVWWMASMALAVALSASLRFWQGSALLRSP